jgi:ribonucleoside-diphosphate reductase alpha chain
MDEAPSPSEAVSARTEPSPYVSQKASAGMSQPAPAVQDNSAPLCYNCGNQTQRAGSCYVCTSCGSTTGCS